MAFVQCLHPSVTLHSFLPQRRSLSSKYLSIILKVPLATVKRTVPVVAFSSPRSVPASEQDVLEAIAESDGISLPGVRTYENDLARLTLVGAVHFEQALTAAAADGGEAAAEHIASGVATMVVETVFPGTPDEHSTVSTRLFLPARKVKEKARKLKSSLTEDIFSSTTSQNILAMTFRQVVLSELWNFEMLIYRPGTERNMEELENLREVPPSFALSSSNERVISALAEVVCLTALESTERRFLDNSLGKMFRWLQKRKRFASKDSAVTIHTLFEDEIIASAKGLLETFNSEKGNYKPLETTLKNSWWSLSTYTQLEKIGGPEFSRWITEYVPAYRLQVDFDRLHDVKFEGWQQIAENRFEVLLTHSQMVGLANILDMYYEDIYSLPDKQLSYGAIAKPTNLSETKRIASLMKFFSITLASGFLLVIISILAQFHLPQLHNGRKYAGATRSLQSSDIDSLQHHYIESTKLDEFCVSVVQKLKDAFSWPGDIKTKEKVGAWIGEIPVYLRGLDEAGSSSAEISSGFASLKQSEEEIKTSTQDVATYQVVMSAEGRIIGFQPLSRVAVNQWSANPLAKELYGGRKLSPGFIEPGLNIKPPNELAVIELLMSSNRGSGFALARPFK